MGVNELMLSEAVALASRAAGMGAELRLLGGVAIRATCPSSAERPFARDCGDLDFAGRGRNDAIDSAFAATGWEADEEFNLYNGPSRLIFKKGSIKADVFLGSFRMCHEIRLERRLSEDPLSIPLAELLLTKLQVFEANDKDLADAACILADHELGPGDGEFVNAPVIARACARDWGLWRTAGISLEKLAAWIPSSGMRARLAEDALRRVEALEAAIAAEPKTSQWRLRSAIGDRIRWYELPEEVER
jgi:hypothetical protein